MPVIRLGPGQARATPGPGELPPGDHVLALLFRGEASLTVGEQTWSAQGSSETLLVALVSADTPWGATWQHEGPDLQVFLDGRRLSEDPDH